MEERPNSMVAAIRNALSTCAQEGVATCFPTILLRGTGLESKGTKYPSAEVALAYYAMQGFESDRTRMNLNGYPGMLRDLNSPPPWVEVEPDDVDEPLSKQRLHELRPLIRWANETSEDNLILAWNAMRQEQGRAASIVLGQSCSITNSTYGEEAFRQLLTLAKSVGSETFGAIFNAVFDFDEFTPAAGAPDLLVWLPRSEPALWFFSEVKGPGDSLRDSQKQWLHQHWNTVRGHYLLTILD